MSDMDDADAADAGEPGVELGRDPPFELGGLRAPGERPGGMQRWPGWPGGGMPGWRGPPGWDGIGIERGGEGAAGPPTPTPPPGG